MVKKPEDEVRKIIGFDSASWIALSVLSQDTMLSVLELMDEAVRDLLIKRGRPALLIDALKASVPETERPDKMTGPVTLGDLAREGKKLWLYCNSCYRDRDVDPSSLPLPPETVVPTLGRRHMKCSACGSKNVTSWPELYRGAPLK